MIGVTHPAGGNPRRYYKCCGRDLTCPKYQTRCPRRMLRAEPLEDAVWGHVGGLIAPPEVLRAQFDTLAAGADDSARVRAEAEKWEAQLRRLDREEVRLVDAYQSEAITLDELKLFFPQFPVSERRTVGG